MELGRRVGSKSHPRPIDRHPRPSAFRCESRDPSILRCGWNAADETIGHRDTWSRIAWSARRRRAARMTKLWLPRC